MSAEEAEENLVVAAERLRAAGDDGVPCAPVRDLLGDSDVARAYRVQDRLVQARIAQGATVSGRKVGLTAPAVQRQLGVDQPDFGVLFADMDVSALEEVPFDRLLQPRIEAEVAFGLASNLDHDGLDLAAVRSAVAWGAAALEIVDSRVADWDIRITDTVADNASSGLYVISGNRVPLSEFEPRAVRMTMDLNGERVSEGDGAACLGDPLEALLWLARVAHEYGRPLQAGQVVLSGALGPMVAVTAGAEVRADITALGPVRARFTGR
jgi:2-keto-4-pentenoate hydratase